MGEPGYLTIGGNEYCIEDVKFEVFRNRQEVWNYDRLSGHLDLDVEFALTMPMPPGFDVDKPVVFWYNGLCYVGYVVEWSTNIGRCFITDNKMVISGVQREPSPWEW